ncbi:unnamed protein product, partial [Protopolystoma xenopodis]
MVYLFYLETLWALFHCSFAYTLLHPPKLHTIEMLSIIRQNFHEQCEAGLNKQINMELFAHYTYLSMAYYFNRDDVALKGFHKFFLKASTEEREHAMKLMEYQNLRGGHIVLADIQKPARH